MAQHGKRYRERLSRVDRSRLYSVEEAVALLKDACGAAPARFDETVGLAVRLGVNPKHADQMVRGSVVLPRGLGKQLRVIAFAKGEKAKEALDAGADAAGAEELTEKVQGGWLEFDRAVAAPDVMGLVGRLGKILGPRGLMPNPKSGTVGFDVGRMVREAKAGKVEYRVDKAGIVHAPVGKVSFEPAALGENVRALLEALARAKPAGAKGSYFRGITLASTMGPGVKVDHVAAYSSLS